MSTRPKDLEDWEISICGIIGITSDIFNGSINIAFPKDTFLYIMEGMLGEKYEEIDKDLVDGCGEILNISLGIAKKNLNTKGFKIMSAIPTILEGKDLKTNAVAVSPIVRIPFKSDNYRFLLFIVIENG